jgi:hypothetical protein
METMTRAATATAADGTTFLCLNEACTDADRRRLAQSSGAGTGDS